MHLCYPLGEHISVNLAKVRDVEPDLEYTNRFSVTNVMAILSAWIQMHYI